MSVKLVVNNSCCEEYEKKMRREHGEREQYIAKFLFLFMVAMFGLMISIVPLVLLYTEQLWKLPNFNYPFAFWNGFAGWIIVLIFSIKKMAARL